MTTTAPWPPQLILDIALESHDLPELLAKFDLTATALDLLYGNPQFLRELLHTKAELASSGSSFRVHARVMAEEHLQTMNDLLADPTTPVGQRITLWQSLVRFAALEPPKEALLAPGGVTINIAGFAAAPRSLTASVVDVTPRTLAVRELT